MEDYFVSYQTFTPGGGLVGSGGSIMTIQPPRNLAEIKKLGDQMTDGLRNSNIIRGNHWVSVVAWSRMGD